MIKRICGAIHLNLGVAVIWEHQINQIVPVHYKIIMSYLNILFIFACSKEPSLKSENINYEINAEALSVLISDDLIYPDQQYSISFARQLLSNPILEIAIYNHSEKDIPLTGNESSWLDSNFVDIVNDPPNSLPAYEEVLVDLIWHTSVIEEYQEETQDIEDTKISIPFSIPYSDVFSFVFEVELVDSLDIVFLGDDGYSLLSSENTDDFIHEQWDTSTESEFLFAQFYEGSFWRLDLKDENTSVLSVSENGLNWTEIDMGLADKTDFCQVIEASMICFSTEDVWVSYAGQSFEKKSLLTDVPHFLAGVTHPFRAYLVGEEGIFILHPSGYFEQVYESSVKLHHIATNDSLEMVAVGEYTILYSDDGQNWQNWDTPSISGVLQNVHSFVFPSPNTLDSVASWVFGVEEDDVFSIWSFQEGQFEHMVDLKLIDVVNNMIFAVDESNWIYRSKNGQDWQKVHKLPTSITLRRVVIEQRRNFEGFEE